MRTPYTVTMLAFLALVVARVPAAAQVTPSRSVLRGFVVDDANEKPVAGATVSIDALRLSVVTDSLGAFRLPAIPLGRYIVAVKRIGFGALTAVVAFTGSDTLDYDFGIVKQATALPEVAVTVAPRLDPRLADFEDRRKAGFGRFLTESLFVKNRDRRLSEIMATVSGVRIIRGTGSNGWLASSVGYSSELKFRPASADINRGADPNQCYAAVILDGSPVFTGQPGEMLFDVNSIATSTIAGIEYYRDAATVPMKFNFSRGSTCGLVMIWSR